MTTFDIRIARAADAEEACDVMRRSIAELCSSDHRDDPTILRQWLANKTPGHVERWIADDGNRVLVAVGSGAILAVGAVTTHGEITLNYVSPDARFQGVSRAMVTALEQAARDFGNASCHLVSTSTARRFYLSAGYQKVGIPEGRFGTTSSYPMLKRLVPEGRTA